MSEMVDGMFDNEFDDDAMEVGWHSVGLGSIFCCLHVNFTESTALYSIE